MELCGSTFQWTLIIITGASKGIGRNIALSFAEQISTPVRFLLFGRDIEGLQSIRQKIMSSRGTGTTECEIAIVDFLEIDTMTEKVERIFAQEDASKYKRVIFVNNAVVIGCPGYIGHSSDLQGLQDTTNVSIIAPYILTSKLLERFYKTDGSNFINIVNVTSFWAIDPASSFSHYCQAKAGAEMMFSSLALEYNPQFLKVLNYAPGVCDTQLLRDLTIHPNADRAISSCLGNLIQTGETVDVKETSDKCARIVLEDSYLSGARIDYFDDQDGDKYYKCPVKM